MRASKAKIRRAIMAAPIAAIFATLLAAAPLLVASSAGNSEHPLLFDDFNGNGPLNTTTVWNMAGGAPCAFSGDGLVLSAPLHNWNSRTTFNEPVSVRFSGVSVNQLPAQGWRNLLGLAQDQFNGDAAGWMFDGTVQPQQPMLPYMQTGGKSYWHYPDAVSMTPTGPFGDITKRDKAIDLRIDWWPGKLVQYYVNDKLVAEYDQLVPSGPCSVAVLDFNVSFHIDHIAVVRITKATEGARQQPAATAKVEDSSDSGQKSAVGEDVLRKQIETRGRARSRALDEQFPKLRMIIGGPCYMWGIDPRIEEELTAAGMEVLCWPNAPLLDPEPCMGIGRKPTEYNVIIFSDAFLSKSQPDPNTGEIPKRIKDQIPLLRKFLSEGGGVWFGGLGEQDWGRSSHTLNYMLKELNLGAEVVGEVVMDLSESSYKYKFNSRTWAYAWTDLMDDPLLAGVDNLLHPCGVISGEGSMGVVPIVNLSSDWRVLVKGKPTAASFSPDPAVLIGDKLLLNEPKTVKRSPILAAARRVGKGRVVLWPTWTNFTITGGSGGKLVDGQLDGRWSDGARLIENLLCWLAEPSQGSQTVGTFDPTQYNHEKNAVNVDAWLADWGRPGRRDYSADYKGLIGAHSNISDGTSSPEEMIAAARKAGYDFIAFTEDFSRMDQAKWEKLLAACDAANGAGGFAAYAGLDFLDEAGDRCLVFGHRYWIKDEWRSKRNRDRIRWFYNVTYQADSNPARWPPRVIIRSKTNNKRPWNQGLWNFFGAYYYEGGKLVDDSFAEWGPTIGRYGFFMNAGLMAIHTVRSSGEIAAAAGPGLYQTYVCADNLQQVLSRMSGCIGPPTEKLYWPDWYRTYPVYVSSGPTIADFRTFVAGLGGEIAFDLAVPGNNRGLLHILAGSPAGLKEISVHDGERLVRKFRPQGKIFETFITFHPDTSHAYTLTVTDQQGGRAVSWPAFMQIQEQIHRRCGDNWNWMRTGKGPGTLTPLNIDYQLLEVTNPWHPKSALKSSGSQRRADYWCEQGDYSHGGLSAATNPYISPQSFLVDGKPCEGCYSAISLDMATVGRFGSILTSVVRDDYQVREPENATTGAFAGPYSVAPSPWPAELKQYIPMQKPDGAAINRFQGKVAFARKVETPDGAPLRLRLGATGDPKANTFEVMNADGASQRYDVGERTLRGEIPRNGYICWYDDMGDGVGGIIALSSGVQYSYGKKHQECSVYLPSPVSPGAQAAWDVIFVSGNRSTRNSNAQMEDIRLGLGISGKPTLYEVEPRTGTVVDRKYCLTIDAQDSGFSGRIVKTTGKALPIHLPVMVNGLNPRWDAAIWYRGKTRLHTPAYFRDAWGEETWRWVVGKYEPFDDEIRYMPILEGGVGYCQVDTDMQDADIFIGNLLVCDQPDVFITVIKAEKGGCSFEINNPTDTELACAVRPAQGFDLTGRWTKRMTLSAGEARTVNIK